MQTIVIADSSDDLCRQLKLWLDPEYRVLICNNFDSALSLLRQTRPDGLILSLSLKGGDGFYLLEQLGPDRPDAILCTSVFLPGYISQKARDLGVGYLIQKPCRIQAIVSRIRDMVHLSQGGTDLQEQTAHHLKHLGICHNQGYDLLRIGIPLYAQDPSQRMVKDLYPAIAQVYRECGAKSVESTIRDAISKAYTCRNIDIWEEYFPDVQSCPSNKIFIARLSQEL